MKRISKPSKAKQGNIKKHDNYRVAWARINKAEEEEEEYYLEAIVILESIMSDRLLSKLRRNYGFSERKGKNQLYHGLNELINAAKKYEPDEMGNGESLWSKVHTWRISRNEVIHGLLRSDTGKPPVEIEKFFSFTAKDCCVKGKDLCRKVEIGHDEKLDRAIRDSEHKDYTYIFLPSILGF